MSRARLPSRAPLAPDPDVRSLEDLLEDYAGAADLTQEILELFICDVEAHLARLSDAIDTGAGEECRRAAHRFKGAAAAVGATGLQALLRQLEVATTGDRRHLSQTIAKETTRVLPVLRTYVARL